MKYTAALGWAAVAAVLAVLHVAWGPVEIPAEAVVDALRGGNGLESVLVREVRLPRVLTAAGAGSALALCGLALQTWFHNPLCGPSVLGITSGASLGVALTVLAGFSWHITGGLGATAIGAVLGASAVLVLVLAVSARFSVPTTLLIFGLMLGHVVGAVTTVLQAEARSEELQRFVLWGMGSFGSTGLAASAVLVGLAAAGGGVLAATARHLDAWTLGPWTARSMGMPVARVQWTVLGVTGVLAGVVTALCGPVAFLGLATPHVVRFTTRDRSHRVTLPTVAAAGAAIALAADVLVRAPWDPSGGWPLNAVLSLLGAPVVVAVVFRNRWAP
jgi:iron complex transport system permease protein